MNTLTEVQVNYPIDLKNVRSLLISALEGGSNYWMFLLKYEFPPNTTREDFIEGGKFADEDYGPCYILPFIDNGGIVLEDKEERTTHTLTKDKVINGLKVMAIKYPKHFMSFITENDDCVTADIFLQCICSEKFYMVNQVEVVLVYKGENLPSRKFDRVPMKGETIIEGRMDNFYYVKEVFWREDGSASLLLGDDKPNE